MRQGRYRLLVPDGEVIQLAFQRWSLVPVRKETGLCRGQRFILDVEIYLIQPDINAFKYHLQNIAHAIK